MTTKVELCTALDCTQCGSCIELCSHHAIVFSTPDKNGDKIPIIDETRCVQCGICRKNCPQLFPYTIKSIETFSARYFAGWSKKYRLKGSSGGLFGELAEYVISNNGYVCGAAFDNDGILRHRLINQISQIEPLLGSKYLTSEVHGVFPVIKNKLKENRFILFVGTPCQVAGLKRFLKIEYDKLLTVDLVCFGCPSQEIYQAYISKIPTKSSVVAYKFRRLDSNRPDNQLILSNSRNMRIPNRLYTYIDGFVRGLCMKKACYNCHYKNLDRVGDITLGDYHTIRKEKPLVRAKISKGVSLICVNTPNGFSFFLKIKKNLELFEKDRFQASMTNISLREQLTMPDKRDDFCSSIYDEDMHLEDINRIYNLQGLKFSRIRFNPFFIKILDLKKDLCQFVNSLI